MTVERIEKSSFSQKHIFAFELTKKADFSHKITWKWPF